MMRECLTNKTRMYRALNSGLLGNHMPTWNGADPELRTLIDQKQIGPLVSIRAMTVSASIKKYHVPVETLFDLFESVEKQYGLSRKHLTVCEAPPDDFRTIQGEVSITERGLSLFSSFATLPMRNALEKDGTMSYRLKASSLLKQYLDACDCDWLHELLELYPDHTIEFTGFTRRVGVLNRRMLIWEVRAY